MSHWQCHTWFFLGGGRGAMWQLYLLIANRAKINMTSLGHGGMGSSLPKWCIREIWITLYRQREGCDEQMYLRRNLWKKEIRGLLTAYEQDCRTRPNKAAINSPLSRTALLGQWLHNGWLVLLYSRQRRLMYYNDMSYSCSIGGLELWCVITIVESLTSH